MISAADEQRHGPDRERLWEESWYLDFAARDGSLGGYVRLATVPREGTAWFWAAVAGPRRPLVTLRDHDVTPPRGRTLEARAGGLWVDLVCETPLEHWSVGLEAFGVALDDPVEAWAGERGDPTALGLDLEWEAAGPADDQGQDGQYGQACSVHGDVLVGSERIPLDGTGARWHAWGSRDWWAGSWCWAAGTLDDGSTFGGYFAGGSVQLDRRGLPVSAALPFAGGELAVSALAAAPVLVPSAVGGGRPGRLARALCRFEWAGRVGHGWAEWLEPDGLSGADAPVRG